MYAISRLLLIITLIALVGGLAGALVFVGPAGFGLTVVIAMYGRKRNRMLTSHGSSRWSNRDDLRSGGLTGETGLVLGYHVPVNQEP